MAEPLFCVGCDRLVCHTPPEGHTLAIACACGATSPILHMENGEIWGPPSSLVRLKSGSFPGEEPPHLEFYLGYSHHPSELRDQLEQELKALGCISQRECPKPGCKGAYLNGVRRLRDRRDRKLADSLEQVCDAMEELQRNIIEKEGSLPPDWPEDAKESTRKLVAMLRGEEEL